MRTDDLSQKRVGEGVGNSRVVCKVRRVSTIRLIQRRSVRKRKLVSPLGRPGLERAKVIHRHKAQRFLNTKAIATANNLNSGDREQVRKRA
jgi:hypothetical protein